MHPQMEKRAASEKFKEIFPEGVPSLEQLKALCEESEQLKRCEVLPMDDGTGRIMIEAEILVLKCPVKDNAGNTVGKKDKPLVNKFVKGADQEEILYLQAYMWADKGLVWNGIDWKGAKR